MAEIRPGSGRSAVSRSGIAGSSKPEKSTTLKLKFSGIADAAGDLIIQTQAPQNGTWEIQRGFISNDGVALITFGFYEDTIDDLHIIDEVTAAVANRLPFDNFSLPVINPGQTLFLVWAGCTPGSACNAAIQVVQVT